MKIFEQEKKDGISELILSKGSVQFDTEVRPANINYSQASVKNKSRDIFGLESILVSIGWNKNDDVFDPVECWRARATPINKKFNYMHNEKDIIGHITSATVLDKDGNIIADDTEEDDLPEFFEISVSSIMYTYWQDKELQARANDLMAEIAEGKWFVSMEVLFPDFDYALSKGSEQKIIERNEETSFLTKHLRIYNGKGEYEGWKIGRKLKDMFFSGKGLVNNPANKRSLITSFNGAIASANIFNEVKMSVEQKEYDKAVAELGVAKNTLESVNKDKEALASAVETLKGDLESSKAMALDLKEEIKKLKESEASKDAKVAELTKSLAEVLATAKNKDRVSQLVDKGVAKEKAEAVVEKFAKASDEMFAEVVELHASKAKKEETEQVDQVDQATENLDKSQASAQDELDQESNTDSADKVLEASFAFIKETLKKDNK